MEPNVGWLETILKKRSDEESVAKVMRIEEEDVVSKGDNYASDMIRIKMDVIYGSGKNGKKSLIIKQIPQTVLRAKHLKEWGVFKKETRMYLEILPNMEDLLEEIGDRGELLWGRCLDHKPYTRIMFEDLKESGYVMADKRKGLDLSHTVMVVESLAKFHALSALMKERGLLNSNEFQDVIFNKNSDLMQAFQDTCFNTLSDVIDFAWEPEYKPLAGKLRSLVGKTNSRIVKAFQLEESEFNVLCHGDCWVNNMLFKHNHGSTKPIGLKFVDFQMSYYNIPGLDLQYFLTTSLQNDVREKHLDEILTSYHESLLYWLKKLEYIGRRPTLEEVNQWIEKTNFFGFFLSVFTLTFMLTDPDDAPDLEMVLKDFEEGNIKSDWKPYLGKVYTERTKFLLKYFEGKGVI